MPVFEIVFYILLAVIIWFLMIIVLLFIVYGREFKRLWQEPMLRYPVVIFDSDDWGVGPVEQISALTDLLNLFLHYQDNKQQHPKLALGLILAEPDFKKIQSDPEQYYFKDLSDENYTALVQLIKNGFDQGVFDIYLHGMEHYWPSSLMSNLHREEVKNWLSAHTNHMTEDLPSFLQSRWCDTRSLPSSTLSETEIEQAVLQEQRCFKKIFEQTPKVVVPPTFVWTEQVIKTYVQHKIHLFITPGKQFTGRNADGALVSNGRTFLNGECDSTGACYLVRDIYFEPEKGHKADRVINDIINHTACGRPSLIEMHRFNFLKDKAHSLSELKKLLDMITKQLPESLYFSAEQLIESYKNRNKTLLVYPFFERISIWLKRIQRFLKYKRLAKYSGFNIFMGSQQ